MTKLFLLFALFYLPAHAEVTICDGDFALCAAATCTPTGNTITNNAGETYPEVECKCPILHGKNIADPAIGNMQGSCSPTDSDHVWSTFWPRLEYPQESNHFSHEPRAMRVVVQKCPAELKQGYNASNCFSWNCKKGPNGIAVCKCPMGQVPAETEFFIEAGQGELTACFKHPVSFPYVPD